MIALMASKKKKRGSRFSKKSLYRVLQGLSISELIILLDDQRRVVWFDRSTQRLLGWKESKILNRRLDQLAPFSALYPQLGEQMEAATPIHLRVRSGGTYCFYAEIIPYRKKRQLLVLRECGQQLQQEVRQREFVANASHELRTPLTILGGYLEQLVGGETPSQWRRPLEVMGAHTERMLQIVEDMLLLSGLEQVGTPPRQEVVDVAGLLGELVESHSILINKREQRFNLEVDPQLYLRGTPDILKCAFSNLMVNAIKYTQKGGEITVRWEGGADETRFMVQDNGPGIPMEDLQRLTERFYRVDKGRSRELGGTGLGLSIVQGALQAHEAELVIESQLGEGSRFSTSFPGKLSVLRRE